ncbi:MAG: sensor histidine kinase, partial [Croceitalea sp.]|nr:sensor histidine kinase [Croceitalea sp.]
DAIDGILNDHVNLNFYRFIQECLNNIIKHADAKAVSISIKKHADKIVTTITDNGKGFNVLNAKAKNSLGLKTLYERIHILNGDLNIDSQINKGTKITATFPI